MSLKIKSPADYGTSLSLEKCGHMSLKIKDPDGSITVLEVPVWKDDQFGGGYLQVILLIDEDKDTKAFISCVGFNGSALEESVYKKLNEYFSNGYCSFKVKKGTQ